MFQRQTRDLPNELEGHVYGDVDGLNTPENVSVTPELPEAQYCAWECRKGPGTEQMRRMHAPTRRALRAI